MSYCQPARTTTGRIRIRWVRIATLLVCVAAVAAALGARHPVPSTSPTASRRHHHLRAPGGPEGLPLLHRDRSGALGEAEGAVPEGTTIFDDGVPGVARLDPALLGALRQAATDAAGDGVAFLVDSGWRSRAYQDQLFRQAVSKYGSEAEAARWVAPPNESAHVQGAAVDLASAAAGWLHENGARYGLCQIYANEPWHFELRPEAVDQGCPAMYADPTRDPRMQQ